MAGIVPRDLGPGELDDPGLRGLLRLATDYDETALTRLVVEELPALVVLAAFDDDGPAAMAAYRAPVPGPGPAGSSWVLWRVGYAVAGAAAVVVVWLRW